MQSEKLDRRITLQRFTSTQDETGQVIETWSDLASVWASKRDVSDAERLAAAEVSAEVTTRFQIRYDSAWADLNPKDRLTFEGKVYNISAVKELGRHEGLEITAAARAD